MGNNKPNKLKNFIVQGGILALAGVLVRILGLAKRIPLPYIIGDIGNSYYSVAYEIYNIVFIISAYGIPLSVSKLVSAKVGKGEYRNADKIFRCALGISTVTGIITSSLVFIFADKLSRLLNEPMSFLALRALAPLLFLVCIMGVFRGYFQGLGSNIPTAISQLVEQIFLIIVGLSGAYLLTGYGEKVGLLLHNENYKYAYGACGATMGCTIGALCGLIFLIMLYKANLKYIKKRIYRDPTHKIDSTFDVIRNFIFTVIPVILSNFINYVSNILDMYIHNLFMEKKGIDSNLKSTNWGIYSGKYLVIINIPIAISAAMGVSTVPAISGLLKKKEYKEIRIKINKVIKITMLIAIPCAVGVFALAPEIMWFLFSTTNETAYNLLRIGAPGIILFSLMTLTTGILQGLDHLRKPIVHGVISLALHVTILISLLNFTDLNIYAVALSNNFFSLFMCIMNIHSIRKVIHQKFEIKNTFIMPFVSSAIMGALVYVLSLLFNQLGHSRLLILLTIIIGAFVYFAIMLLTRTITKVELESIPGGDKLYRFFKKLRLCS